MLTELATHLSSKLINFKNMTEHHISQIGEYLYLPDCLANKQFPYLVKALGHVVKIKDRSILIKLSNGQSVWRHASDLVSFNLAGTDRQNIDVLDLLLNGHPDSEPLLAVRVRIISLVTNH